MEIDKTVVVASVAAVTAAVITGAIAFAIGVNAGQNHVINIARKNLIQILIEKDAEK